MTLATALPGDILPVLGCLAIILPCLFFGRWLKTKLRAGRRRRETELSRLYYDTYDELLTLVRERQHDMNNHISAILGMLYTIDNYDELVHSQWKYLREVMHRNEEARLLLSIENPILVGFIYQKIQQAGPHGIQVEYRIAVKEREIPVSDYDLIDILGILFDNAMEALLESPAEEKRIRLEIVDQNIRLWVSVANTSRVYGPEELACFFEKDFTSRGEGRGLGLKKLKKIVQRLKGEMAVSNNRDGDANYLQFDIFLPK